MFTELAAAWEKLTRFLPATFPFWLKIVIEISWQRIHFYNFRIFIGKGEGTRISVFFIGREKCPTNFTFECLVVCFWFFSPKVQKQLTIPLSLENKQNPNKTPKPNNNKKLLKQKVL